jgi:hypothetical protein
MQIAPEMIAQTRRAQRLARLRSYYESTQYKGRPDFWTGLKANGETVPLQERAPAIIYKLPKACVNQATRFTFGEGRFPTIKIGEVKPDRAIAPGATLSKTEAASLQALVAEFVEQARLKTRCRTLMRHGLTVGTAVVVLGIRQGRFEIETPHAEHCEPTFRPDDPTSLQALVWCYQFCKLVKNEKTGVIEERPFLFRRDITEAEYVVYRDTPVISGETSRFERDEAATVRHDLGFCPARWIKNLADEHAGDIDGCSLYGEAELPEFDALNFALSQRHRGIKYWGIPQPWESGVDDGDGPAPVGRGAAPSPREPVTHDPYTSPAWAPQPASRIRTSAARPQAPDQVWSFRNKDVKLGLLETTGAAFDAATKHVLDLRSRLIETLNVVFFDPKDAGTGEISGKALALLHAPLLALVDELRDCWWPEGLGAIVQLAMRMVATLGHRGTILLPGVAEVATILQRFLVPLGSGVVWIPPPMQPVWGAYFSPSAAETETSVQTATEAKTAGHITKRTAAAYVAADFGVQDVDAELAAVDVETDEEPMPPTERGPAAEQPKPEDGPKEPEPPKEDT